MSLQDQEGLAIIDQAGLPLIDQLRYPAILVMNQTQELTITDTPSSGSRSSWTTSLSGVTTVSVRGDWGAATTLDFVYTPVGPDSGDVVDPPAGEEFPIFKQVAAADTEMVFQIEPSDHLYKVAVIPTDNDGTTDLQIVFA